MTPPRAFGPLLLVLALVLPGCADQAATPPRNRVLLVVVDGLRPDYVTPDLMPRLNALAERGVRGTAHHAVFPTVTRVNGPSIVTGAFPSGHGQMGNSVYLPDVDPDRVLDAGDVADLRRIEERTGGRLLTAPSLGRMLADQGRVFFAVSSGSTGSAALMNHTGAGAGLVHHALTVPDTLAPVAAEVLGPPPADGSGLALVARAVDAALRIGLDRADADMVAVWLTEPDGTAHARGMGAPETVAVLAGVDAEIGRLLDGLEARGLADATTVLVTSDHGFSRRVGHVSLTELLVDAGLKASDASMDVVVAGDAITVREGGPARVDSIVALLQATDWIGPVFTRGAGPASDVGRVDGTASFAAVGWDHPRSSDVLTSAGWSDSVNAWGYRGAVFAPGTAGHGSTSPWDIRATFVAAGPAVRVGVESDVPTGNVDLAPTALALLGASMPASVQGRVLREILRGGPDPASVQAVRDSVVVSAERPGVRYTLVVDRVEVDGVRYLEGTRVRRERAGPARPPGAPEPPATPESPESPESPAGAPGS